MKKWIWLFVLALFFFVLARERLIGVFLEPVLERTLADLFGMPVAIDGLKVDPLAGRPFRRASPLAGRVKASRIEFTNQSEFAPGPHLEVKGMEFDINLSALREGRVRIREIFLNEPYYFIDRIATPEGPRNNVKTWYRHMKQPRGDAGKKGGSLGRPREVKIDKISLTKGTFIFHDRSSKEGEKKFVFQELEGTLAGFEWPSPDPSHLSQAVKVRGTFGEDYPAPFTIVGGANFATSKISFDLTGEIEEGNLLEHRRLWEGSSIDVKGGKFKLKTRTVCLRRELQSSNHLILKSVKVKPGPSAADKVWGLPMTAAIGFLENQKTIHLKIPVHGNISDPQFEFNRAFRAAFQEALSDRTHSGLQAFTDGTAKLASQTQQIVRETPGKLADGLGKIVKKVEEVRAS